MWLHLPGEWNEKKGDRLWREMSFLEIAESDTWGKEAFFSVLEHKTDQSMSFFSFKHIFTNWKQYSIKEYCIDVCESGHGAKTRQPFPSPQKDLRNFESVFITVLHLWLSQGKAEAHNNCQLNPNNIWLVSWLLAISSIMQCCCHTKWSFRYRSRDKWRGLPLLQGKNKQTNNS